MHHAFYNLIGLRAYKLSIVNKTSRNMSVVFKSIANIDLKVNNLLWNLSAVLNIIKRNSYNTKANCRIVNLAGFKKLTKAKANET